MITFPSAKVNLGLNIYNRREDGFHNMETILYPILFSDMLEIVENTDWKTGENKFSMTELGIPVAGKLEENLVFRAYSALDKEHQLPPVKCCLYKQIPMGAGLGGGSADAAFMLKLLNVKFTLHLTDQQLEGYAAQLGSDCAFFIQNQPAYVYGKGHELELINFSLKGWYLVLVYAGIHSGTAEAYQGAKKKEVYDASQTLKHIVQQPVEAWKQTLFNQFEPTVFARFPELGNLKEELYKAGATFASMSGSGSALFGLFKSPPDLPDTVQKNIAYTGWLNQ